MVPLKEVVWLGDSKQIASAFPRHIREDLGFQIYRLQRGKLPTRSRPMKSIGNGVFELKEQDVRGWYRVIYTLEVKNKVYVLHCFEKKSAKTKKKDLNIAKRRLSQMRGDF